MTNWLLAAGAGIVGALVMSIMTDVSRAMGIIEANMSRYQGCIITGHSHGTKPLLAGLASHLMMGAILAIGYAIVFRVIGEATWILGAAIGVAHFAAAGAAFPLMDRANPCVRDGRIRGFGPFGKNYGLMMIMGLFMGHVVYGAIVGAIYHTP